MWLLLLVRVSSPFLGVPILLHDPHTAYGEVDKNPGLGGIDPTRLGRVEWRTAQLRNE